MTMDLMYGCGSEYDPTLEELLEVDLRSEMDRIIAAANGHPFEFMTELEYSTGHSEEGIDEIDIRFDASRFDPFSLSSFGLNPISIKSKPMAANFKNSKANHHISPNNVVNNLKNSQSSSPIIPVKKVIGNIHSRSIYVNQPASQKPTTIVASVGSLSMGGLATLEETLGTLTVSGQPCQALLLSGTGRDSLPSLAFVLHSASLCTRDEGGAVLGFGKTSMKRLLVGPHLNHFLVSFPLLHASSTGILSIVVQTSAE
ncbi:unnamed protein product [Allacma fusca]|uniref:Uncharacterized protein n=1 Tax=Allacma fusca TaxID=39272 RepID=A0A8J2JK20_9HEXA|nr:unnamed protein product [Allacma fusca]